MKTHTRERDASVLPVALSFLFSPICHFHRHRALPTAERGKTERGERRKLITFSAAQIAVIAASISLAYCGDKLCLLVLFPWLTLPLFYNSFPMRRTFCPSILLHLPPACDAREKRRKLNFSNLFSLSSTSGRKGERKR